MKRLSLNRLAQILGSIFGLLGLVTLVMAVRPLLGFSDGTFWSTPPYSLFLLIVAVALLRAAFLGCFRWSPLAVQHLVGSTFFFITIWLLSVVRSYAFWFVLPLCYTLYQFAARRLSRYVFSSSDGNVSSVLHGGA
jgi:hypothetical protein